MRVVCYCKDCQAFIKHLGKQKEVFDGNGGTDIYQMPPRNFKITQGIDQIRCLRLTEKGLHRWYTGCCNTPIGNTLSAKFPFIGLIQNFVCDKDANSAMGPVKTYAHRQSAQPPISKSFDKGMPTKKYLAQLLLKLTYWRLRAFHRPSPLFNSRGKAIVEPKVLNKSQQN